MINEFYITPHAELRILERFKCRKDKIMKVCQKAWASDAPPNKIMLYFKKRNPKNKDVIYKVFNGFVFVFKYHQNKKFNNQPQKVLITVFSPKQL